MTRGSSTVAALDRAEPLANPTRSLAPRRYGMRAMGAGTVVVLEVPGAWTTAATAEEPADPTARACVTFGLASAGERLTA